MGKKRSSLFAPIRRFDDYGYICIITISNVIDNALTENKACNTKHLSNRIDRT